MRNRFIVLTAFVLLCSSPRAQSIYYDAMALEKLNESFTPSSLDDLISVASLIGKYLPDSLLITTDAIKTIDNFKAHNPFMGSYFSHSDAVKMPPVPFNVTTPVGGAGPPGNLDVTTITDGLAKFLVNRTKEELSVAFFSTLKEDLENKKYVLLQTLFPLTYQQLELMGDKIYQFSAYLNDMRSAFIADLNNFSTTLPYVLVLPQYEGYFKARPWVAGVIQMGFFVGSELATKTNNKLSYLNSVIKDVVDEADDYFPVSAGNSATSTINGAIKTFGLISASFAPTFGAGPWLSSPDFLQLVNNDAAFKIYLGLLYQQSIKNPIVFGGGITLTKLLDSVAVKAAAIQAFKSNLSGLMMQMNVVDQAKAVLDTMRVSNGEITSYYYAFFNTGTSILQKGLLLLKSVNGASPLSLPGAFFDDVDKYTTALHDAGDIYINIQQKKFAPAISSAADFFTVVLSDTSKADKNIARLLQRLSTYGTFIAEVATAKTSNEVDSIITQTVLPTGSSYIKKHSRFNIAAQAYTGLYGGQQRQATDTKFVGAAGVYAPVGIAFSWGLPALNKGKAPGALSIFASIIDIGPMVSFRFSNYNDSIANNTKVRLSQIVSPGLHLVYGVPNLPVSVGVGCNWAPLITDVEANAVTAGTKNAFRYQAFIAVDIPLLNFYNNPR